MKPLTSKLLIASAVAAGAVALMIPYSEAQRSFSNSPWTTPSPIGSSGGGGGLTDGGLLCLNGDCSAYMSALDGGATLSGAPLYVEQGFANGSLAGADRDVYGNTFVAANRSPDGGAGTYSFISLNDSCVKTGPGSNAELCSVGNALTVNYGAVQLPTTNILQPACNTASTCRWYSDAWAPGVIPRGSLPACGANHEGGQVALSTDHRPYYCDGTSAQKYAMQGGPWSGSLDFSSFGGQGCQTLTFTATGAVANEPVAAGGCGAVMSGDNDLTCNVAITATNTASVRLCCMDTLGCSDLAAITFTATALR